ncbi:hypothetical protein [Streptomyces sp. NBC_00162]|uniref:hypothetical protein n=1 Tax=Streptomyces sp. NBC_00162 TaxID=2903629 RepID=UPI00214C8950|nr:hypothetical protein [Streptomyces sp. NBC_00162]UUU44947.1 hypothetical protein JIW86_37960 [Streptomyces sp. NBC_00162]
MEFNVGWFTPNAGPNRRDVWAAAERRRPDAVAVSLPPAEVGDIRRALEALAGGAGYSGDAERAAAVIARMDEAEAVTVLLPADDKVLQSLLGQPARCGVHVSEDSVQALDNLRRHLALARPVTGTWFRVRDTLQDALRETLSRPGAEGLAARDELIDVVSRFVDTYRTATAADDVEQCRLQAERPQPDDQTPPLGPAPL